MALDEIWKQQLTLITYGNEYLNQSLSVQDWVNHSIFNQHSFHFRDLLSQHLLAQHFQIWLEDLKNQGCHRISLHSSSILSDEHNPNANVELLAFPHFIVSHHQKNKFAWILGKELAEWYKADNDYEAPKPQTNTIRQEVFWRYDLNPKLFKRVDADLQQPNWDDIKEYTDNELFNSSFAKGFLEPLTQDAPYLGKSIVQTETPTTSNERILPLLPIGYSSDYANRTLARLEALSQHITSKLQHPTHEDGSLLTSEQQLMLRHFDQKLDDLYAKFIVKVANHYQTAQLTPVILNNPLDDHFPSTETGHKKKFKDPQVSNKSGAFTLIIVTIIICLVGYYFGL